MIFLPPMPPEQTASWMGLLDLHERPEDLVIARRAADDGGGIVGLEWWS